MLDLTREQQLQNTVDELLRVEKARKVGEVCGVIAALAVGIGYGVAGLPILSIALMAVVAGWVVEFIADGIVYTVLKPNGKLEPEKQQLQNTMDELLRVEKARKVGKVCSVIAALAVGIGCGVAGLPMSLIAFVAVVAGWVVEFIANNIAYAVLKPSGKLEEESRAQQQKSGNLTEEQRLQNAIDKFLRVEKAKEIGEACGVAAMLAVGIGCGVAGLPISSIIFMACAAGWAVELVADGIACAVLKPNGELKETNAHHKDTNYALYS